MMQTRHPVNVAHYPEVAKTTGARRVASPSILPPQCRHVGLTAVWPACRSHLPLSLMTKRVQHDGVNKVCVTPWSDAFVCLNA